MKLLHDIRTFEIIPMDSYKGRQILDDYEANELLTHEVYDDFDCLVESILSDNKPNKYSRLLRASKYIQDNFCPCNACNGGKKAHERCQMWFDIGGKRRLAAICHFGISRIKHGSRREPYTEYDKDMLKRMLDLRFAQIDNEK